MKNLYIVRHSKAAGQAFDAPLTEEGFKQAEDLVRFFAGKAIDQIIASPFLRTRQTIQPLSASTNLPIELDGRLGERVLSSQDLSDWQEKLEETFLDIDLVFEGGESNRQALERAKSLIDDIITNNNKNIVLVSHGNLTTLLLQVFDKTFGYKELMDLTNPDVYHIIVDGDTSTVNRIWTDR